MQPQHTRELDEPVNMNNICNAIVAYCKAALAVATAHNLLTADERSSFEADLAAGRMVCATGWSSLVVYDLSSRCRSFAPVILTDLIALGRAAQEL